VGGRIKKRAGLLVEKTHASNLRRYNLNGSPPK